MKRDWELIRLILLEIESLPPNKFLFPQQIKGFPPEVVSYHFRILKEAGLIVAECNHWCIAKSLTWEGYEFLDRIRENSIWNKIGNLAVNKGISLSFESIKELFKLALKEIIGG